MGEKKGVIKEKRQKIHSQGNIVCVLRNLLSLVIIFRVRIVRLVVYFLFFNSCPAVLVQIEHKQIVGFMV